MSVCLLKFVMYNNHIEGWVQQRLAKFNFEKSLT